MQVNRDAYFNLLVESTVKHIDNAFLDKNIINRTVSYHIAESKEDELSSSLEFQRYYCKIMDNKTEIGNKYINEFKSKYSIQGVDGPYLEKLQNSINEIKQHAVKDQLLDMYKDYFLLQDISHGKDEEGKPKTLAKTQGSLFTKLLHTFNPQKYCALDNLVKNELGLKNESYFVALQVVSEAYKIWCTNNPELIDEIRKSYIYQFKSYDIDLSKATNMKFMDLIFWAVADEKVRNKKLANKS